MTTLKAFTTGLAVPVELFADIQMIFGVQRLICIT
jgi:hypothetical protein